MDKIVISDTNILIDLYDISLLDHLFVLPVEVHVLDLTIFELNDSELKKTLGVKIQEGSLYVESIAAPQMPEVLNRMAGPLSLTDCAVWYCAKVNDWMLLTGDKKLRTKAIADGVRVVGILHILDVLLSGGLIDAADAAEKLEILWNKNKRLPKEEVESRLRRWTIVNNLKDLEENVISR